MAIVNEWQQVKSFPTPIPSDLLFYEIKDSNIPRNENWNYGDPHPNKTRYPNHKLIFVTPVVKGNNPSAEQQWWYAAERESQDLYNFSHTEADIGGTKFDAVARTYVTLRSAFTPNIPSMGTAMPNVPESLFTGTYVLAEKRQTRIDEQQLDSLYVAETHVYVRKVTLTDNGFNEALGVNLSRTTTLYYRGETVNGVAIEILVADDKNLYWGTQVNLKISRSCQQLSDNWFAVIEQQITLKRSTSGALTDDWQLQQEKAKGQDSLVPAKFKRQVITESKIETIDLAAANVDDIPEPDELTGDIVATSTRKVNDYRYESKITSEVIAENLEPLEGEQYGKIVTVSTSESLVEDGTFAETGINVISSTVSPLGNGKSIKVDEIAKGGWPDPLDVQVTAPVQSPPSDLFVDQLKRRTVTRKVSSIPDAITLAGDEVGKEYRRETPDRVEESVTLQTFEIRVGELAESIDRKIYLETTSTTNVSETSELPESGSGSSRLVYRAGEQLIFENSRQTTLGIATFKGTDTKSQEWGAVVETSNYDLTATTPAGGSSVLVHNDGQSIVYENVAVAVSVSGSTLSQSPKEWGSIQQSGTYSTSPQSGFGVTSRQVWSNGVTKVFLNEVNDVSVFGSTLSQSPQEWGSIQQSGTYSTSPQSGSGVTSRQVWSDGVTKVFLNEVNDVSVEGSTLSQSPQAWGTIQQGGTYSTLPDSGSGVTSRQVWSDGVTKVFLNEVNNVSVSGSTLSQSPQEWGTIQQGGTYSTSSQSGAGVTSRQVWSDGVTNVFLNEVNDVSVSGSTLSQSPQAWGTIQQDGTYSTSPQSGAGVTSKQVWSDGVTKVFLNEVNNVLIGGSTNDIDPQNWGSISWNGSYSTGSSGTRSRQVWSDGSTQVYLNESPNLNVSGGDFVSAKEIGPLLTETQTTHFSLSPSANSPNSRSDMVFSIGDNRVYRNTTISIEPEPVRTYGGVIQFSVPSVLLGLRQLVFPRKDGKIELFYEPEIEEGFSGAFPCEIKERFTLTPDPPTLTEFNKFAPKPVSFTTPYGSLKIPPTLHGDLSFDISTGTEDPVYELIVVRVNIPPTNITHWRGQTVIAAYDTTPYKNGFIVKEYKIEL